MQDLTEVFKMYRGFSTISLHKFFLSWIQIVEVLGVINVNSVN